MRKLTVGQVGCGNFAEKEDMPNFRDNPKTEIKWCCDLSAERSKKLADKYGVPNVTSDLNEVLNDPEVDMIKVATSHESHLPIVKKAAGAGKHVFCEKPLAIDTADCLKIIRAVKVAGIKLCVDYNRRKAPSLNALREQWKTHNHSPEHQPWRFHEVEREMFPEEKRTNLLVRVQDESSSYRLVHLDALKGGGELLGESVHWLDLARWFYAPQVPVKILAWGSSRLSHGINIWFSEGDQATIIFSCGGSFDYPKELYEVTCKGALFRSRSFAENNYYGTPRSNNEKFDLASDGLPEAGKQGGFDGLMEKIEMWQRRKNKTGIIPVNVDKGHKNLLNEFVDSILEDKPSPCDEMDGYVATYLARQAMKSIELGQALPLNIENLTPYVQGS